MIGTAFLFPHFCAGCCRPGVVLCYDCLKKQNPYQPQKCIVCNSPSYLGITHKQCVKNSAVWGTYSFFRYQQPFIRVLKRAKYQHSQYALRYLLKSIPLRRLFEIWELKRICPSAAVVGIPQYKATQKERGFNQAEIIGEFLSHVLSVPYSNGLVKNRNTRHQSTLSDIDRFTNLNGAYSLTDSIPRTSRSFIVADDVITTGTTIEEAARSLRSKYPNAIIYAVSLFRSR